jgi:hypothetical protein
MNNLKVFIIVFMLVAFKWFNYYIRIISSMEIITMEKFKSLFEIAQEFQYLLYSDINEDNSINLENQLNALDMEAEKKLLNLSKVIKEKTFLLNSIKEQKKILYDRCNSLESEVERMKNILLEYMNKMRRSKIMDAQISIQIKTNPPKLNIPEQLDIQSIPSSYLRKSESYSVDKISLTNDINHGVIDLTSLGIEVVQNERVEIK